MRQEDLAELKVGNILHNSWGYSMTLNDYCKILEIGKTIKAVMLECEDHEGGPGEEWSMPTDKEIEGSEFRIRINKHEDNIYLTGTFSFIAGQTAIKRKGSWNKWNGQRNYLNTWD